jgi:hypothetical protein
VIGPPLKGTLPRLRVSGNLARGVRNPRSPFHVRLYPHLHLPPGETRPHATWYSPIDVPPRGRKPSRPGASPPFFKFQKTVTALRGTPVRFLRRMDHSRTHAPPRSVYLSPHHTGTRGVFVRCQRRLLRAMALSGPPDVGALLNDFVAELGRETRLLQQVVTLKTRADDHDARARMAPLFAEVDAAVSRLEANVEALRAFHTVRAAKIAADAARVDAHARVTEARIAAIREHLPDELLHALRRKEAAVSEPLSATAPAGATNGGAAADGAAGTGGVRAAPKPASEANAALKRALAAGSDASRAPRTQENRPPSNTAAPASSVGRAGKWWNALDDRGDSGADFDVGELPHIPNVTHEEMSIAPSYVKGRLTVGRAAPVVAALNKVLRSKYAFLAQPIRTLTSDEVTRRHDIQAVEAECGEIEGRPFFTDVDCREGDVRFDSVTKSVVNLLRHVGALKEIRGRNRVRIFILVDA